MYPAELLAREAFTEYNLAHVLFVWGEQIDLVLDLASQIAQHLHRTLMGDRGVWGFGQPTVAVHHHILNAIR